MPIVIQPGAIITQGYSTADAPARTLLTNIQRSWSPIIGTPWKERTGNGSDGFVFSGYSSEVIPVTNGMGLGLIASADQYIQMAYGAGMALSGSWQRSLCFSIPAYVPGQGPYNTTFVSGGEASGDIQFIDVDGFYWERQYLTDGNVVDDGSGGIHTAHIVSLDDFHLLSIWWDDILKTLSIKLDAFSAFTSDPQAFEPANGTEDWFLASEGDGFGAMDGILASYSFWQADDNFIPGESGHDALYAGGTVLDYSVFGSTIL